MQITRVFALALAVVLSSATLKVAASQEKKADDRGDDQQVQLSAEEVLLDVVATDSKGRPVLDLKPGDLTVIEQGDRQQIASFTLVRSGGPEPAAKPTTAGATAAGTLPSSISASPFQKYNLIMIVIDRTTIQNVNLKAIQGAANDFVEKRLTPYDLVAVFALSNQLTMLQNFTNDSALLLEAIRIGTTTGSGPIDSILTVNANARDTRIVDAPRDLAINTQTGGSDSLEPVDAPTGPVTFIAETLNVIASNTAAINAYVAEQVQSRQFVQGMFALLKLYDRIPDRKSVVVYSEGLAVDSAVAQQFATMVSSANRNNYTIYTVDAAGLRPGSSVAERQSAPLTLGGSTNVGEDRSIVRGGNSELGRTERDLRSSGNAALLRLASETGGLFIRNTNDLKQGFERVEGDLRSYYLLSYVPTNQNLDGKYRKIEVRVSRKDVKIRTRDGYFAVPGTGDLLLPFEQPVLEVISAGTRAKDLRGAVELERFVSGDLWEVPVALAITGRAMEPLPAAKDAPQNAPKDFEVDVVVLVRDSAGHVVAKLSRRTFFGVPLDRLDYFKENYLDVPPFPDRLMLKPGTYTATVAFYDPSSRKASVEEHEFTLGPLPSATQPATSSLVLARGAQPAGQSPAAGSDHFIVPGNVRVLTNPSGRFSKSRGDRVIPYFRFWGKPGATHTMKIEFTRDGKVTTATPPILIQLDSSTGEAVSARAFPLDGFEPGVYTATLTVTETTGDAPIIVTREFEVVP